MNTGNFNLNTEENDPDDRQSADSSLNVQHDCLSIKIKTNKKNKTRQYRFTDRFAAKKTKK